MMLTVIENNCIYFSEPNDVILYMLNLSRNQELLIDFYTTRKRKIRKFLTKIRKFLTT